jgi:hypothetical protein
VRRSRLTLFLLTSHDAMTSIKRRGAQQEWTDVCFPGREKQGSNACVGRVATDGHPMTALKIVAHLTSGSHIDDLRTSEPQFCLVCQDKVGHAVEAKVVFRGTGRRHCRAPALVRVTTVDPRGRKSEMVSGRVVMK